MIDFPLRFAEIPGGRAGCGNDPPDRTPAQSEGLIMVFGALASGILLGFFVGLFSFKIKSRWCPVCGRWTVSAAHR